MATKATTTKAVTTTAGKAIKRAIAIDGIPTVGAIADAFGTKVETEVARVKVVMAYRASDTKPGAQAIVSEAIKRNRGKAVDGFSVSTVNRYIRVADVLLTTPASALPIPLTDDKGNATEAGGRIVKALASIANYDGNVAAAIKAIGQTKTQAGALAASQRLVNAASVAQADRKAGRAGKPNAVTGAEKSPAAEAEAPAEAVAQAPAPVGIIALAQALMEALSTAKVITTGEADALADVAALAEDTVAAHYATADAA